MKIGHIINPVRVSRDSDLFVAQPITFESMRRARRYAQSKGIEVEQFYACFEEDLKIAPYYMRATELLRRSVIDIKKFRINKKLPLIKDILDLLQQSSDSDFFIYTNVDIALQEDFYSAVTNIINAGYDAFVINRRTLSSRYSTVDELESMYEDKGELHPGYDCFVFDRHIYQHFDLGDSCIGANWIGRILVSNMAALANKFTVFEGEYLTFHIGDDRNWSVNQYIDYDIHNEVVLDAVLERFNRKGLLSGNRMISEFHKAHRRRLNEINTANKNKIIAKNRKMLNLQDPPDGVYGCEYKPSSSWCQPVLLSQEPVFIVGFPRSGTTLLQSLIATQKGVVSLPETHYFNRVRSKLKVNNDLVQKVGINDVISSIRERVRFSVNAENHAKKLVNRGVLSPKMLFEMIITDNLIDRFSLEELRSTCWVEKTPDHVLHLDVIKRFYPDARIIFTIRNPEKAIISRRKHFPNEMSLPIEKHIQEWRRSIKCVEDHISKYPEQSILVRFEDLAGNTRNTMEMICRFINIEFSDNRLADYKKMAKEITHPWETWKSDVINNDVDYEIATRRNERLNESEMSKLIKALGHWLCQYEYDDDRYHQYKYDTYKSKRLIDEALDNAIREFIGINAISHPVKKYMSYKAILKKFTQAVLLTSQK